MVTLQGLQGDIVASFSDPWIHVMHPSASSIVSPFCNPNVTLRRPPPQASRLYSSNSLTAAKPHSPMSPKLQSPRRIIAGASPSFWSLRCIAHSARASSLGLVLGLFRTQGYRLRTLSLSGFCTPVLAKSCGKDLMTRSRC